MSVDPVERLLDEADKLLVPAFVERSSYARERLYAITHELLNDHHCNGAELGRRWGRNRRTISVWKNKGARLR